MKAYIFINESGNSYTRRTSDFDGIYNMMLLVTEDPEISQDAASWCELATEGEVYTFREGSIEIHE